MSMNGWENIGPVGAPAAETAGTLCAEPAARAIDIVDRVNAEAPINDIDRRRVIIVSPKLFLISRRRHASHLNHAGRANYTMYVRI